MTSKYDSEADANKTAAPSLDLEKGESAAHKTSTVDDRDDKHKPQSGYGQPDHDFRAEERDDIPAAVDSHVALDDYPDGGLTAWLVTIGVCTPKA